MLISEKWQQFWNSCTGNKLQAIRPSYTLSGQAVKHILVECSDFNDTRNKHFVASSMEELFRTVDVHNTPDFIKETHFHNKL